MPEGPMYSNMVCLYLDKPGNFVFFCFLIWPVYENCFSLVVVEQRFRVSCHVRVKNIRKCNYGAG